MKTQKREQGTCKMMKGKQNKDELNEGHGAVHLPCVHIVT